MTCDIKIEEVFNGYIVTIGCQRMVIEGRSGMEDARQQLLGELSLYLQDRDGIEKSRRRRFGRKKRGLEHTHTHVCPPADGHRHTVANVGHNHPDHDHDNARPVSLAEGIHHIQQFEVTNTYHHHVMPHTNTDIDHTMRTGSLDFSK